MAVARYLPDKSALARKHIPAIKNRLEELGNAGLLATCGIIDLEVLYSAQSPTGYADIVFDRQRSYEWLFTEDGDFGRALEVQGQLAAAGRHRAVPLPDLLIAAVAERHRVTVLHYDRDFDVIGEVTGQAVEWVAPAGEGR